MKLLPLLVLLPLLASCAAETWTPSTFPNPSKDVERCGRRGVASWVCDPDGIMPYQSANVVEGVIKKIAEGADPYIQDACGAEFEGYQASLSPACICRAAK